jgi:aminoglycoside phosphotransferase (APT) family kinase protein
MLTYIKEYIPELVIPIGKLWKYYIFDYIIGNHIFLMNEKQASNLWKMLSKLHNIPIHNMPENQNNMYSIDDLDDEFLLLDKTFWKQSISAYLDGLMKFNGLKTPLIEKQTFTHNDIHFNNILFKDNVIQWIIDIDKIGISNPEAEYYLTLFNNFVMFDTSNNQVSRNPNAQYFIEGYHDKKPQHNLNHFFFYVLHDLLSSIPYFMAHNNEFLLKINVCKLIWLIENEQVFNSLFTS